MQAPNDLIECEGRAARTRGTFSGCNPHRFPGPSIGVEAEWLRKCNAWWRGWDLEDACRRSVETSAWPPFAGSDFQSSCPEKSALLRSLAEREPGIRGLQANLRDSAAARFAG